MLLIPTMLLAFWIGMRRHARLEEHQMAEDVQIVADAVRRSFEIITPNSTPVHRQHVINTVGELELIDNVRVVAINGSISFSLSPDEVGQHWDRSSHDPCRGCHQDSGIAEELEPTAANNEFLASHVQSSAVVPNSLDGTGHFNAMFPIPNQPSCLQCHQAQYEELGQLLVSFDMSDQHAEMSAYRRSAAYTIIVAVLVAMAGIALLFQYLVRNPLRRLQMQMQRVEGGQFELGAPIGSRDELGQLYAAFAGMTQQLAQHQGQLKRRVNEGTQQVSALTKRLHTIDADLVQLERLSALGALSAQVVHEVRTPLNALSLNLQLLQRELRKHHDLPSAVIELTDNYRAEVDRMSAVLSRFMHRARLPRARATREPVDKLVQDVLAFLAKKAETSGVELTSSGLHSIGALYLPADYLRQVLINLVSNGIRACGGAGVVAVDGELVDSDHLILRVIDTGQGIPEENLELIFDPFFTTRSDGTGLGLAVVRQIVERVDGRISVDSTQGEGSCFTVDLPVNRPNETEDG